MVFVQFSVAASKQLSDAKSALAFIEKVAKLEHVQNDHQAALMCKLEAAHLLVIAGNIELAKTELAQSKKLQDEYPGIMETVVYSKYHLVSLCLFKATDQASKYFASAMLYLTYTPLDSIPIDEASALAVDVGLAALHGDNIYNFGELLQHPILNVLSSTSHKWVADMLLAFNSGNLATYEAIFLANSSSNSNLAAKQAFLAQKARVMCLMESVFALPSSARIISFSEIASICKLNVNQVELLVMKAFSLKVLRGSIDQLQQTVRFTWVQPRVLDNAQTARLRSRLATWGEEVSGIATKLEQQAPELIGAR